ncbi:polyprenyl synthetase family protein [Bacillus paralicheniformis]|uniref:polyprenyl synthetase family protein n=1 Tax=Bacillus paralicheniformis TaxID=1648923 RepID=UPI0009B18074|nr:polyprenyl synthetase family protein [Bacillus paralicheniformis]ARA87038.1 isoprenyl transferase [Bacillus paralicheniformis]MCW4365777.1 polyprenyl synthetase family protein [Bacillus paralicheniformis]MDR9802159.1 polyprenyl synthetase family protein [Bacillus paralicheniformis]MEB3127577.1 polyprenyl synthetase family protein [Bacillus paralicheniformis]MEC1866608.1 polyprenyl synthetase family protein [Bacillus paralicheniformis]
MNHFIDVEIPNADLNRTLHAFLDAKDQLHFSELAFYHYQSFGGTDTDAAETLGAGIELLILAFDIFDDLEDEDSPDEPWMKINRSVAMNAATALYTLGIKVVSSVSNDPAFLHKLIDYILQSSQGQHEDLRGKPVTEEECLDMIKRKSGSLVALSCVLGTMLATGKFNKAVETYAYQLGIASQIENDYKALFYDSKSDIAKKKRTLAYLYLSRKFNQPSIDLLKTFETKDKIADKEIKCYKGELKAAGVTQYMYVMNQLAIQQFKKEIEELELEEKAKEDLTLLLLQMFGGEE